MSIIRWEMDDLVDVDSTSSAYVKRITQGQIDFCQVFGTKKKNIFNIKLENNDIIKNVSRGLFSVIKSHRASA